MGTFVYIMTLVVKLVETPGTLKKHTPETFGTLLLGKDLRHFE